MNSPNDATSLFCPRCDGTFRSESSAEWIACPHCMFEFHQDDFFQHAQRVKVQVEAARWNTPSRIISDTPLAKNRIGGISMSFWEWLKWKCGHRKTTSVLLIRSGLHQVLLRCCELADIYRAVPRNLRLPNDVDRFWLDPHHKFKLGGILQWMRDTSYIAEKAAQEGDLTAGDLRNIFDREVPTVSHQLGTTGYYSWHIELRGFKLAFALAEASLIKLPPMFLKVEEWLCEKERFSSGVAQN